MISTKPPIVPAVAGSPRMSTPNTTATAGFTYVIRAARVAPAAAIKLK